MKVVTTSLPDVPLVLVTVAATQGSAPREAGAWMAVSSNEVSGTIGGGHLEFEAIAEARRRLGNPGVAVEAERTWSLGPGLGQCCGGVMRLRFERFEAAELPTLQARVAPRLAPLAIFGGGHVGKALVNVLATLPFEITWIDSRDEIFPDELPEHVQCEHSDPVQAAVADLETGSRVLIMSFSHAEDLDIVAACLRRQRAEADLPYIGLIGSKTKWATFRHRLEERGFTDEDFAHITCPIGLPGIAGKEPEVIAVSVAAQILQIAPPGDGPR
ncbi:MAG: xanthine dehydrogenase accessory protein XdhC [Pseudomonadota bacterium]